jgi:hypothetical protein
MLNNVENTDMIDTCSHTKFVKLTMLNYTKWAAYVTTVLITEDALEIVAGHEDVPVVNEWAAATDDCC